MSVVIEDPWSVVLIFLERLKRIIAIVYLLEIKNTNKINNVCTNGILNEINGNRSIRVVFVVLKFGVGGFQDVVNQFLFVADGQTQSNDSTDHQCHQES